MCTICGLPTTHASTLQTLGLLAGASFVITSLTGAWLVLTWMKIQTRWWSPKRNQD